jgi:hypothetical protein
VLTVNADRDVVERQLAGGELACPSCGDVLTRWGNGAERRVRMPALTCGSARAGRGAGRAAGRMCCCRPGAWPGGPTPGR